MRGLQMQGVNRWAVVELPRRPLQPQEVRIRVSCVGICGSDLHMMARAECVGRVLGHEFSGVVIERGEFVSETIQSGDRVSSLALMGCMNCELCRGGSIRFCREKKILGFDCLGAFAEEVIVDSRVLEKLPTSLSDEEGALLEPLSVAFRLAQDFVKQIPWKEPNVLLLGDGPIALADLQMLRAFGVSNVGLLGKHAFRMECARKMGASWVFTQDEWEKGNVVLPLWDVCVLAAKAEDALCFALERMRTGGVVFLQSRLESSSAIGKIVTPEIVLRGSFAYEKSDFGEVAKLLLSGIVDPKPFFTKRFSFLEAANIPPFDLVNKAGDMKILLQF